MELFYNPISTYSQKVIMALEEKSLSYDKSLVELSDPQSRKAYRAIYPLGKVPVLRLGDMVLGESTIIVEWLELNYPEVSLIQNENALDIRRFDRLVDMYLIANISLLFFQSIKPQAQQDMERIQTAQRQINVVLKELEHHLSQKEDAKYLVSNAVSLADLGFIPALLSINNMVDLTDYPSLQSYAQLHKNRPSLLTARAEFEPAVSKMMAVFAR